MTQIKSQAKNTIAIQARVADTKEISKILKWIESCPESLKVNLSISMEEYKEPTYYSVDC